MASPVGHAAFGVAAASIVVRATGTQDSAALWVGVFLASGVPDLDVVFPLLGWSKRYHRNATHSLLFAASVIALGYISLKGFDLRPAPGVQLAWVAALLSHLLLDVLTTGPTLGALGWGIPLLWPLSARRFYVRRPWFVGDRTESLTWREAVREMREDAVAVAPWGIVVVLLARFWSF